MADRRADDTPLAPRRSLSGPTHAAESDGDTGKRPFVGRVSAAVAAAGNAVQSAASPSPSSRPGAGAGAASRSGAPRRRAPRMPPPPPGPPRGPGPPGPRRGAPRGARLRLVHLDPWSVMKTAFLL